MTPVPQGRQTAGKRIAGIATRTTNAAESNPAIARIPSLWGRFMGERWAQQLEALGGFGPTIAVYSGYESDVTGSYQLLLGRQIDTATAVGPAEQVVVAAPGSYLVFACAGPLPQAVIDGWQAVWAFFERPGAPARAYTYDFEIYPDEGPVEIWVAVEN